MKLFVGLGNPGKEYESTRHNVGFLAIDYFAKSEGIEFNNKKFKGVYGQGNINGEKVIVFKPLTYMNLSGEAVLELVNYFNIDNEDIVVVYDDMDLPIGKLRLREKGSAGGQNGMKNILALLKTTEIKRIRIGLGSNSLIEKKNYVLGKFSKDEKEVIETSLDQCSKALRDICTMTFVDVMSRYNKKD